jgi:hypothetical protein
MMAFHGSLSSQRTALLFPLILLSTTERVNPFHTFYRRKTFERRPPDAPFPVPPMQGSLQTVRQLLEHRFMPKSLAEVRNPANGIAKFKNDLRPHTIPCYTNGGNPKFD